jgi:hypothetical protein
MLRSSQCRRRSAGMRTHPYWASSQKTGCECVRVRLCVGVANVRACLCICVCVLRTLRCVRLRQLAAQNCCLCSSGKRVHVQVRPHSCRHEGKSAVLFSSMPLVTCAVLLSACATCWCCCYTFAIKWGEGGGARSAVWHCCWYTSSAAIVMVLLRHVHPFPLATSSNPTHNQPPKGPRSWYLALLTYPLTCFVP